MMGPVFWLRHRHRYREPAGDPQPTIYDFTGGTLPSGASLTRSSVATYFDSTPYLASAAVDVARFDHDPVTGALKGLRLEAQSSNIQKYSAISGGTGWSWGGVSCAVDTGIVDPFGTNTATRITETTALSQHRLYSTATTTIVSGNKYTASAFVKAGTDYVVGLGTGTNTGLGWAVFDLSSGVVSNSGTSGTPFITPLSNGWFRIGIRGANSTLTGTPSSAGILYLTNNNPAAGNQPSYTGDGSYFYATTVCLEPGLVETSPILGVITATITRAADQLTLNIPNGGTLLRLTFDDDSTQDIDATAYAGSTCMIDPTTITRPWLKRATIT